MNASCTRLVTGASDNQLRMWTLEPGDEAGEEEGAAAVGGRRSEGGASAGEGGSDGDGASALEDDVIAVYMGSVVRQGNGERSSRRQRSTWSRSFPPVRLVFLSGAILVEIKS